MPPIDPADITGVAIGGRWHRVQPGTFRTDSEQQFTFVASDGRTVTGPASALQAVKSPPPLEGSVFSAWSGELADIMDRALNAIEVEHDQLDRTPAERQADHDVLSRLDAATWPGEGI